MLYKAFVTFNVLFFFLLSLYQPGQTPRLYKQIINFVRAMLDVKCLRYG